MIEYELAFCPECGGKHPAEPSHENPRQGMIFAVVCDGYVDFYTSEVVREKADH